MAFLKLSLPRSTFIELYLSVALTCFSLILVSLTFNGCSGEKSGRQADAWFGGVARTSQDTLSNDEPGPLNVSGPVDITRQKVSSPSSGGYKQTSKTVLFASKWKVKTEESVDKAIAVHNGVVYFLEDR